MSNNDLIGQQKYLNWFIHFKDELAHISCSRDQIINQWSQIPVFKTIFTIFSNDFFFRIDNIGAVYSSIYDPFYLCTFFRFFCCCCEKSEKKVTHRSFTSFK